MPTQEERLTALEKTVTVLQRETATHIREVDENLTILLGVIKHQGRDIKGIFGRLETIDSHLESMDTSLNTIEQRLDRLETKFDQQTALLTQILERLPKAP